MSEPTARDELVTLLGEHGHSGTVNSAAGVIICICGERLAVTFDDPEMGYANADEEEAVLATHLADVLLAAGWTKGDA